jgi:hypothetical protein
MPSDIFTRAGIALRWHLDRARERCQLGAVDEEPTLPYTVDEIAWLVSEAERGA